MDNGLISFSGPRQVFRDQGRFSFSLDVQQFRRGRKDSLHLKHRLFCLENFLLLFFVEHISCTYLTQFPLYTERKTEKETLTKVKVDFILPFMVTQRGVLSSRSVVRSRGRSSSSSPYQSSPSTPFSHHNPPDIRLFFFSLFLFIIK